MLEHLKQYGKTHLFYIIIIAIGLIAFRSWLSGHDARVLAEQTIQKSEVQVKALQDQIKATDTEANKQVEVVVKEIQAVRTPAQAVAAIPDLSSLPLDSRPGPTATSVTVEAIPLAQTLAQCKQDSILLQACQQDRTADEGIISSKQTEIVALKKKPSFWKRVEGTAKAVGIGVGIGILLGGKL